jgi:glycosyltransferase involved in cell wall biosynthesis
MRRFLFILDFIPRLPRTMERWLIAMASSLKAEGIELHLLLSGEGPEWFGEQLKAAGGSLHWDASMRNRFDVAKVNQVMASVQPQAVCVLFYPMLSKPVLKLAFARGVKRLFYIDQSSTPLPEPRGWKRLPVLLRGRLLGRLYHQLITVAEFKRERLTTCLGLPPSRIVRIYNGVPLERFATATGRVADDAPLFYAGQIAKYKGIATLIEAWKIAARSRSMPRLLIAGDGPQRVELEQQVAAEGLSDQIQFLGLRPDVPELMMAARLNVIPSEWDEACAFVALEAMASGRPVLASDAGSLPELLAEHGHIFRKGDAKALAAKLLELLDESRRAQLDADGAALRVRALANFDMDQMVAAYTKVFAEGMRLRTSRCMTSETTAAW